MYYIMLERPEILDYYIDLIDDDPDEMLDLRKLEKDRYHSDLLNDYIDALNPCARQEIISDIMYKIDDYTPLNVEFAAKFERQAWEDLLEPISEAMEDRRNYIRDCYKEMYDEQI